MERRDELMAAVLAAPDDDGPRLVFADWLLEQDEALDRAHGELVQVQCALAKLDDDGPDRARLVRREAQLLHEHAEALSFEVLPPDTDARGVFRRGFVAECLHTESLDDFAPLARLPLEGLTYDVWMSDAADNAWARVAELPLERLSSLTLARHDEPFYDNRGGREANERLIALLGSERLARVRRLTLREFSLRPHELRTILEAPAARSWRELRIFSGTRVTDAHLEVIASAGLDELETLVLRSSSGLGCSLAAYRMLGEAPGRLPALRRLLLDGDRLLAAEYGRFLSGRPRITKLALNVGRGTLLDVTGLDRLEEIKLVPFSERQGLLAAAPRPRRLSLPYQKPTIDEIRAIARIPWLRGLDLRSAELRDDAAEALLELESLDDLDLGGHQRFSEPMKARLRDRFGAALTL